MQKTVLLVRFALDITIESTSANIIVLPLSVQVQSNNGDLVGKIMTGGIDWSDPYSSRY